MKRDFIISVTVHVLIVAATMFAAPFSIKSERSYDEIIRVTLTAAPMVSNTKPEPAPMQPLQTPAAAMDEDLPEIPLEDPTSKEQLAELPKPKPEKPKTKPQTEQPKPKPQENTQQTEASSDATQGTEIDSEATGAGSPFAGATVDDASFNYPYWFRLAFTKIQSNWRNTVAVDATLVCVVYFQVIKSGRVIDVRVEKSSGIARFDQDCVAAIERAGPFPPLPREFREEIIGITLPFKFEPR